MNSVSVRQHDLLHSPTEGLPCLRSAALKMFGTVDVSSRIE